MGINGERMQNSTESFPSLKDIQGNSNNKILPPKPKSSYNNINISFQNKQKSYFCFLKE
jgi:hypothetical protein